LDTGLKVIRKKHKRSNTLRYIILIPHRDALKPLDKYRASLFAKGFYGAHSFPLAAPLAEVSKPFSRDELKKLAMNIRNLTIEHKHEHEQNGKIIGAGTGTIAGQGELSFFGLLLNLPCGNELFAGTAGEKIKRCLFPPVLCASLVSQGANLSGEKPAYEEAPVISFRAAALANLSIRPLEETEYSFEWKIGTAVWLPAFKKQDAK
jgi:hypothetical protein